MDQKIENIKSPGFFSDSLDIVDQEIHRSIKLELDRQQKQIELIASENIVSKSVLEAQGSIMTNKYAEGYPGRRYYGGCEHVDVAEEIAIERACKLFNVKYANVQPHSGSQANQAVYKSLVSDKALDYHEMKPTTTQRVRSDTGVEGDTRCAADLDAAPLRSGRSNARQTL